MATMEQEELHYEEEEEEVSMNDTDQNIEFELETVKARVREMEEEAEKLRQIQTEVDKHMSLGSPPSSNSTTNPNMSWEEKMEVDARSIYVGSVDYGASAEELEQHFHGCGAINRVTILCNKYDGHPKGFAYVEFADKDSVSLSLALDESLFRGRQLKVLPKRTNKPGVSTTNRVPRGMRVPRRRFYSGGYRPTRRPFRYGRVVRG